MFKPVILLCSHNGESYIEEQLKSILSQTCIPNRIYVFDFDSSDSTQLLVKEVQKSLGSSNIVELVTLNYAHGAADSFFSSMKMLKGTIDNDSLIFFCDQDDTWDEEKIYTQISSYEHSEIPYLSFHDVNVTDSDGTIIHNDYFRGSPCILPDDISIDRLILGNCVIGHTMMINFSLFNILVNIESENYLMHDWAAVLFASKFGKIKYHDIPLTNYRQHDNNVLGVSGSSGIKLPRLIHLYKYSKLLKIQILTFLLETECSVVKPITEVSTQLISGGKLSRFRIFLHSIKFSRTIRSKLVSFLFLF